MKFPWKRTFGLGLCLAAVLNSSPNLAAAPEVRLEPAKDAAAATRKVEQSILDLVNAERRKKNLAPLRNDEALAEKARTYSRRMAKEQFFSHVDPQGVDITGRYDKVACSALGENLFSCTNVRDPERRALTAWMSSEGHRQNILMAEFTDTGIGVWKEGNRYFVTQVFIRKEADQEQ